MTRRGWLLSGIGAWAGRVLAAASSRSLTPVSGASLVLEVDKTGLLKGKTHRLVFPDFHGEVTETTPNEPRVNFSVKSASLRCEDTWVKEDDRVKIVKYGVDDLLEASKYPEIVFASTAVKTTDETHKTIEGTLTIRKQSHPVSVAVEQEKDSAGKQWWKGSAVIRLRDFNLKPPSAALGTIGTKNEMRLSFRLADG